MKRTLPLRAFKPLILLLLLISISVCGQRIDSTFTSPLAQRASEPYEMVQQPDGKIILAGDIDFYDSKSVGKVIRLNLDGSHDKTLKANLPADFIPYNMELMSSGSILLYDYTRLIKLGPNGALKTIAPIQGISSVLPLPNGKVMVTTWSGGLYRYKANLTLDSAFQNQASFANGAITDVALQGNKLVICGSFDMVNGALKNDLARLSMNGTVDNTFDTGAGTNDWLPGITINPMDGKIYLLTYLNSFDGVSGFFGMGRLDNNGTIDSLFRPATYSQVKEVFFTSDNKIVSSSYSGILKFNEDGTPVDDFTTIIDGDAFSTSAILEQLSDGTLLVAMLKRSGGDYGIAKFNANGIQIPTFSPPVARVGTITTMDKVNNKKVVVAGEFFMLNKHRTNNVARLNANGSVDTNFKAVYNDGSAFQCTVLPDGKILVSSFNDFSRLQPNGELDQTFAFSPFKGMYQVENFRVMNDGRIIGAGPNGVYQMNSDGSEDITFNEGTGFCCVAATLYGFDVQSSGKFLYGGFIDQYNGTPVKKMLRANNDGSIDLTFNVGTGPNNPVSKIKALSNDDLIVGGWFDVFDGQPAPSGLVKLKADGLLDTTFHAEFTPFAPLFDLKPFGEKILISTHLNGKYDIAVLDANGAASTDFILPSQITAVNYRTNFYARDNNTLYMLGNLTIAGQTRPSLITKIIYTPTAASSARLATESTTSDKREASVKFSVYPNPAQREIIFDVDRTYDVRIVKYSGEVVMKTTINEANNSVDISTLKADTYVIQLILGNKKRQSSILVKH
jgi:uncharacterized delta-60 repeat protein